MALQLSLSAQNTLVVWSTFSGGLSYKMECLVLLAFGVFWGVVVSPREEYCTESGWRQFPPGADEDRDAHKNARANRVGSYLCLFYPQWSVEGNALVYCHHDNRGHPAPHNRNLFIYARVSEFHYVNSMDSLVKYFDRMLLVCSLIVSVVGLSCSSHQMPFLSCCLLISQGRWEGT